VKPSRSRTTEHSFSSPVTSPKCPRMQISGKPQTTEFVVKTTTALNCGENATDSR
jgi:hypothetical protein